MKLDELVTEKPSPRGYEDIETYMDRSNWILKENANFDVSYSGLQAFIAHDRMKKYTLSLYPERIRQTYKDGYFHIHNLSDGIVPYCYGADLFKLLKTGLSTGRIKSKPAKHLNTAVDHIVNFLCTSQQEWAGAQALSNVNFLLAPFVHKDDLSYEQVKQNMQRLIFNLNFPSRSSYQTPFTNLIFDSKCPKQLREMPAWGDGGNTYEDYYEESELILRAFNAILYEGDATGRVFTFPIPTLNLIKSTEFDSDLFYEIIRTDRKFGNWYFMNYIGSGIDEDSVQAMCCRLTLDLSQLPPAGGRWALSGNTGSIGVVTLNLGRIGYLSKDESDLFTQLNFLLSLSREALETKGDIITKSFNNGLMPLAKMYDVDLDRFFRTIGVVGLNEMMVNFTGEPLTENLTLGSKILSYLRDWTRETQKETGVLWNLEMTPAEGSATSLAMKDRKMYPGIYTQGTDSSHYYTSLLTPPSQKMDMVKRIKFEEKLLQLFTGGTVHRIYVGESDPSIEGLAMLTERIASNTSIPYFDFAATFSICMSCDNYMRGAHYDCGACGQDAEVISRVVGYYRATTKYNKGKMQEFDDRTYVNL